jgi:hypothetical protein
MSWMIYKGIFGQVKRLSICFSGDISRPPMAVLRNPVLANGGSLILQLI